MKIHPQRRLSRKESTARKRRYEADISSRTTFLWLRCLEHIFSKNYLFFTLFLLLFFRFCGELIFLPLHYTCERIVFQREYYIFLSRPLTTKRANAFLPRLECRYALMHAFGGETVVLGRFIIRFSNIDAAIAKASTSKSSALVLFFPTLFALFALFDRKE